MSLQKECTHCKKSYSSIYYLRIHETKCKSQKIVENVDNKCEFCNKNFYSVYNLKTHIEKCKSKIIKTQETLYLNNQKKLEEKVKSLETENLHLKNIISKYEMKAKEYEIEKKIIDKFSSLFNRNS